MVMRFAANFLWFLSMLPDYFAFCFALHFPRRAQERVRRKRRPVAEEDVILLEPTSGSTGGTKWILYTRQLQREFLRAVNPWIASLYIRHPSLLFKTHYWSVSPRTEVRQQRDGKRRGFAEDREYLSPWQRALTRHIFVVPASLAEVRDSREHSLLTLLCLLEARSLGIISVWHPSSLLVLLSFGTSEVEILEQALVSGCWPDGKKRSPNAERAREAGACLRARDYAGLWPGLRVVSCWDRAFAAADAERLRKIFPNAEVQGKGLMATEGVVTIPWKNSYVAAITAHTLQLDPFDAEAGECDPARRIPVCDARAGESYGVVLTTGNGFTDYPLGDIVRCTGRVARTPCLEFQFRGGGVVDLHGEKLHAGHVANIIARLEAGRGAFRFAMLMPRTDRAGYVFVCSAGDCVAEGELESLLCENYHYRHARNLSQLEPAQVRAHPDALAVFCEAKRCPPAVAKVPRLYVPRDAEEWRGIEKKIKNKNSPCNEAGYCCIISGQSRDTLFDFFAPC